ncbi:MAG TPA: lipopolysaccharide heptosyltransferase II [Spongiibacteraceae bacterium]|nr:lipopolysaccharide heptosyltransferase II [Spongiibacteraceae bacterium]
MTRSVASAAASVLIVGPAWVGDMVMAQTLFKLLRQQNPALAIDVLAPAWSLPLLARMPEVRRAIPMPLGHGALELRVRYRLGRKLRAEHYDQAILLPNSFKSALTPWFAHIPKRTCWRGEMRYGLLNDLRILDKPKYPLMVQRFAALAVEPSAPLPAQLPKPQLTIDTAARAQLCEQFHLATDMPILALCPGAEFGPAKRWPETHYADVARAMLERGWQVAIFGSEKDQPVAQAIIATLPEALRTRVANLAGATKLEQAVDLLSAATAVVTNDSGLMHIAAATGRPLVVVYGSTSPGFTPPLAEHVEILQLKVDCGPCFQRECPLGHLKCLRDLPPERVLAALDRLLTNNHR